MSMTKACCIGCEQNFYNGNNALGVQECWSFPTAQLIRRKEVSIHQPPPWNQDAITRPSCYRRNGYVYVSPETVR